MYKTVTITYTYGNGLISDNKKEAKGSDTEKRYYHYNHIGSTTAITDADGDLLYRIAYGIYGELTGIYDVDGDLIEDKTAVIRSENLRFLYNGRYGVETGANGLYYMRARYYNPQIKRFINRDIIDGSITDSQSLYKYSYVQGNPVNLIDPFGLCAQDYFSRAGHELLDWLGFIFDPADVINFLWYTAEGNAAMAAATAVAIVPAAGSFIAKGTKQAIKAGKKAAQKAGEKAAKNATEKAAKKAAAKKLAKEATETGVEKAAKEAAEKATEKTAKETAEKTAKEAAEKGIKSGTPNYGKGYSPKGYNPKPDERTFEGYMKNNVPEEKETKLYTKSQEFNTNPQNAEGQFKRYGTNGHGPQLPDIHVHQPTRNVSPKTGIIYGGQGKNSLKDVTLPSSKDIKQLYEYLNNGKYH